MCRQNVHLAAAAAAAAPPRRRCRTASPPQHPDPAVPRCAARCRAGAQWVLGSATGSATCTTGGQQTQCSPMDGTFVGATALSACNKVGPGVEPQPACLPQPLPLYHRRRGWHPQTGARRAICFPSGSGGHVPRATYPRVCQVGPSPAAGSVHAAWPRRPRSQRGRPFAPMAGLANARVVVSVVRARAGRYSGELGPAAREHCFQHNLD